MTKNKNILTMLFDVIFENKNGNHENIVVISKNKASAKKDARQFGKLVNIKRYKGLNTKELNELEKMLKG